MVSNTHILILVRGPSEYFSFFLSADSFCSLLSAGLILTGILLLILLLPAERKEEEKEVDEEGLIKK